MSESAFGAPIVVPQIAVRYFDLKWLVRNTSLRALPRVIRCVPARNHSVTSSVFNVHCVDLGLSIF